jgi:rhodanese-related sulfurtransferase
MSKSLVMVRPELTRLKEHFELKLQAVKQLADVVYSVKHGDPDLVLLDMRDREDYQRGHIKGALSMPLEEIDKRYRDLPKDKDIVTYCYNQYCHLSTLGALKLVEQGISAKEMNVGRSEWVKLGNPSHEESEGSRECNDHCKSEIQRNVISSG